MKYLGEWFSTSVFVHFRLPLGKAYLIQNYEILFFNSDD